MTEWEWFGHAGHFICSEWCRFHLCTKVGNYLVSTVGEYVRDGKIEEIGAGRKYETFVFPVGHERCSVPDCNCGLPKPTSWGEIDSTGYNDARAATRGHMEMCQKFSEVAE